MKVEVWFDFVCPFCYMGEKAFEIALEKFEHKEDVQIIFKSFELNMATDIVKDKNIHQVIADKYHISYDQAKKNNDKIIAAAANLGLHYNFDILKLNTTRLAHKIAHFAKVSGKEKELINLYFKGYFEEGIDIGDQESLFKIAKEIGLDLDALNAQIADGSLNTKVSQDEALANELEIDTIPHFLFDEKFSLIGSESPEKFLEVLRKTYKNK